MYLLFLSSRTSVICKYALEGFLPMQTSTYSYAYKKFWQKSLRINWAWAITNTKYVCRKFQIQTPTIEYYFFTCLHWKPFSDPVEVLVVFPLCVEIGCPYWRHLLERWVIWNFGQFKFLLLTTVFQGNAKRRVTRDRADLNSSRMKWININ